MLIHLFKRKCSFVLGFAAGFALAVLIFSEDKQATLSQKAGLSKFARDVEEENTIFRAWVKEKYVDVRGNRTYEMWRAEQNVTSVNMDMDRTRYGPEKQEYYGKNALSEAEWLKSKIHITCVVFVEKLGRAKFIHRTWGASCNRLYFFSDRLNDTELPIFRFPGKLTSSWELLCESMNFVWKNSRGSSSRDGNEILEWVIFAKDDTIVIPENLRYLVAPLDFNRGLYLGHPVVLWGQAYNIAQAGFVLSKFAFQKIVENFNSREMCKSGGKYWKKEDFYLGKHLAGLGIHPSDTRDRYQRGVFHGYSLQILLWGVAKAGSYYRKALYPPGRECCSPRSVSFSISDLNKMHSVNYMLYHLNVYNQIGIYGNQPAPKPISEDEIWKLALEEEFNITDFRDIDSDRYFEIWSSRFSGPDQLILKNPRRTV